MLMYKKINFTILWTGEQQFWWWLWWWFWRRRWFGRHDGCKYGKVHSQRPYTML